MARIRSTKPEFWDDECLGKMSLLARLTFLGLKDHADDEGRGLGDPEAIWAANHKHQKSGVKACFKRALSELEACVTCKKPHVVFYKVEGCSYYWLPRFCKHQKIDKPSPSRYPAPPLSSNPRDNTPLDQGSGIRDQGDRRGEQVASPPAPLTPSAETAPEEQDEARELDRTVSAFGFCASPGIQSKRNAIAELRRIGKTHEFIRSIARNEDKKPFYEIIRSIEKGKAVPDFRPTPPAKPKCKNIKCINGNVVDQEKTTPQKSAWKPCPDCGPPLESKATG